MINQSEAIHCLLHDHPELSARISFTGRPLSIFQTVQAMVLLTNECIGTSQYHKAAEYLALASLLYDEGNATVKCAIENVFVFSLDRMFIEAKDSQSTIVQLIPPSLYTVYIQQVTCSGC